MKLANIWVCINSGGGPTPDKPEILLQTRAARAPFDTFLNLRVADVWALYREWSSKGARFLTPPIDNDGYEIRCYVMDPDARIIELGQPTGYVKEVADITGTASVE